MKRKHPILAGLIGLALAISTSSHFTFKAQAAQESEGDPGFQVIFDGASAAGWINNRNGEPISSESVQADGLNPHGTGAYVVLYNKPVQDFILDFDYKLAPGCNSGVFLRIGDMKDPVNTGLEIAIDDTQGSGIHDTGAIYDLVPPTENAQKPAGEWNHMTIVAYGPVVSVLLNGKLVSEIHQDRFDKPGKRPDGSDHKFKNVAIKDLIQKGYFGFQDHGQDCWYRDVKLRVLD